MATYVAPRHLPPKPPLGEDCNQCGRCCFSRPCEIAPGLRMRGGAALAAAARLLLSAGLGCNQRYSDEVASPAFDQKRTEYRTKHAAALGQARKLWGLA